MNTYHIWTIGCQMNVADSERLASALEHLGLQPAEAPRDADVVVLNSCVVRQSAEDKVVGTLGLMKPLKQAREGRVLALMGCMVGPRTDELRARFPYVDTFMRPQEYGPLLALLGERMGLDWEGCVGNLAPERPSVTSYVPIIHGCDLMCTFCIIPYRRGRQVSQPVDQVVREVDLLVQRGVREVTLLGQTVDAYGHDLPDTPDLADLLYALAPIDGLNRIRFLTSHPMFMSPRIIDAVANLDKVCEHINIPIQAGDDEVLARMRRRYTRKEYLDLIDSIRTAIPGVSLSTDVIVGFPGETRDQYRHTVDVVREVEFDKVHTAAYSSRPGTIASRLMPDDVPAEEKSYRLKDLDSVQAKILTRKNARLLGESMEVLVDGRNKGRWQGRTRSAKLVFFEDERDRLGDLVKVEITKTSPWSLQGVPAGVEAPV
jgi:tRNA-2-methylthio-N6-dimethylallyladenosine synthase